MTFNSVLLTGSTGSVGSSILAQLLFKGHHVTAIVRSLEKSSAFITKKYHSEVGSGALKLVEMPDMTAPNAFDDLARTVEAIIHVATPLADRDFQTKIIDPTQVINESIFSASQKATSVKRVIITGSIVSTVNLPDDLFRQITVSEKDYSGITNEEGVKSFPAAYKYAKTLAEKKAWEFMRTAKPSFDLVVLLAPSIIGKCIQEGFTPSKKNLGGMAEIYRSFFDVETPGFVFPFFMDVDDVAAIHVQSLDLKIPGNERYLFHADYRLDSSELANKIREEYPQLRDRVPEGAKVGSAATIKMETDTTKFNKVFVGPWKGWWESAKDTVDDIINFEKVDV